MKIKNFLIVFSLSCFCALVYCCTPKPIQEGNSNYAPLPDTGVWRATIFAQNEQIPFNFRISKDSNTDSLIFTIKNAKEELVVNSYAISHDSISIPMHIFDTKILGRFYPDSIIGIWTKNYVADYALSFKAVKGEPFRFKDNGIKPKVDFSGQWSVVFHKDSSETKAIGVFEQDGKHISGTFLTNTGDYRFLEGVVEGNSMKMSTFDGEHAYLFKASMDAKNKLSGVFISGKTGYTEWSAEKDDQANLEDPTKLTYLNDGYSKIDFKFPNENGQLVSPNDDPYNNKVLIVQILGSWCPNCMDETKFLAEWHKKNYNRGVEIIGLAFERKDDFMYASERLKILKKRFNIDYELLFAGKADKTEASRALPMINKIISYPTTIFIDKNGIVRKIHTGFSGPGTGKYYAEFVEEFNLFMDKLITGK